MDNKPLDTLSSPRVKINAPLTCSIISAKPQADPNSSPLPTSATVTPTNTYKKAVHMNYNGISMQGTLHLITTRDYFNTFYPLFFDIPPSTTASYETVPHPHVLIHSVQGLTWVGGDALSDFQPFTPPEFEGADGKNTGQFANDFIALTNKITAMDGRNYLGECDINGNFAPSNGMVFEDVILALPIHREIGVVGLPRKGKYARRGSVYPPRPAGPDFFTELGKVQHILTHPNALTNKHGLSKHHVKTHLQDLIHSDQNTLRPDHILWHVRNNNALLDTPVWKSLCYPSKYNDLKEEMKMPEPWWQFVFPDMRERERWFPGSDLLVDAAYHFSEDQNQEAKRFLEVDMGSMGGSGDLVRSD